MQNNEQEQIPEPVYQLFYDDANEQYIWRVVDYTTDKCFSNNDLCSEYICCDFNCKGVEL